MCSIGRGRLQIQVVEVLVECPPLTESVSTDCLAGTAIYAASETLLRLPGRSEGGRFLSSPPTAALSKDGARSDK